MPPTWNRSRRGRLSPPVYAVGLALLGGAALTGCGGPADPPTAPRASLTPYTLPASAPMAVPASRQDRDEAVDFVLRYFDALNYGLARNDADPLRAMSSMSCGPCLEWVKQIQRQKDSGSRQDGGYVRVVGMRAAPTAAPDGTYLFRASLLREVGSVVTPTGPRQELVESAELADLQVQPVRDSIAGKVVWSMVAVTVVPIDGPTGR